MPRRDRLAARNFVDAAEDGGTGRVVYLGGLGEEGRTLSKHLRSRREVEYILSDGAFPLTTLRAAIVIGAGSASFRMITPRWVRNECQPIGIDDVLAYLVGVLDVPETAGATYEIGGPDVLTYGEILRRTARLAGSRSPLIEGLRNPVVAGDDSITDLVEVSLTPFDESVRRALGEPSGQHREARA